MTGYKLNWKVLWPSLFVVLLWWVIISGISLLLPACSYGKDYSFAWYPTPFEDGHKGYYILWGSKEDEYYHIWDCKMGEPYGDEKVKCTITIPEGTLGDYDVKYFTVVAYVKDLEISYFAEAIRYDGTVIIYPIQLEGFTIEAINGEVQ